MEGWRITCPICGAALEDFRLYTRLFRADPADPLLARIDSSAREGEVIMDRAFRWRHGGSAYAALMRDLLFPQAPNTTTRATTAAPSRLLDLVVPGPGDFFQRLPSENWPCTSRVLPLSMRIPVLAGVAAVSSRPEYWIDRLIGAAARQNQPELLRCAGALAASDDAELSFPVPSRFRILPQNPESSGQRFRY
jgi:hypothetical protein